MKQIRLQKGQSEVIEHMYRPLDVNDPEEWAVRNVVLTGPRGFGKSYVSATAVAVATGELESLPKSVPNKNIALLCGSYQQVLDIYYPLLANEFQFEARSIDSSESKGRFIFKNGTVVKCWSADAYERMRGSGQYLVVCDEITSWKVPGGSIRDAFESVIEPTVTTRWSGKRARELGAPSPGRILIPSTPRGKEFFYDLSQRQNLDNRWKTFQYTYRDTPNLSPEDIERLKILTDPVRFAREYEASFEDSGANVFYTFDQSVHVDKDLPYFEKGETIHCAIDFNIMMNCTSFHAIRGQQLHSLDEMQGAANTEELAVAIRNRFPDHRIICYPDPAGVQRKTSAAVGVTDFSILRQAGFTVLSRSKAPPIVDSVAAVNRKLRNTKGDVDAYIHPRCRGLIESLDRTQWLENRPESAIIDKTQNLEHFSDGYRYLIEYLWSINTGKPVVFRSNSF